MLFILANVIVKLVKSAGRVYRNITVLFVYQAVGKQKHLHTERTCYHIFFNIVAYHKAFFGVQIKLFEQLLVIFKVGLAVVRVFICCICKKIALIKTCPAYAAFGCNGGENRICCEYKVKSVGFQLFNRFRRFSIETAIFPNTGLSVTAFSP